MQVSAYIPCYNAQATIREAVNSALEQDHPAHEIFVVDDGSTERIPELQGVRIVRLGANQGRGAARARAMQEARYELVLGCDASLQLDRAFLSLALPWFEDESVAAVFGRIIEAGLSTASSRWPGVLDWSRCGSCSVGLPDASSYSGIARPPFTRRTESWK